MSDITILRADLNNPSHQDSIVEMTNEYARDPMGGGADLKANVQAGLASAMSGHPTTVVLIAFDGHKPVGIANCFLGFSTFAAKPLLNVHDLAVHPAYRGRGIGRKLLESAEDQAKRLGCCKLTLEVLEKNEPAKRLYSSFGFDGAREEDERKLFLSKPL